jgi:regulator of nonsense transcripts 3
MFLLFERLLDHPALRATKHPKFLLLYHSHPNQRHKLPLAESGSPAPPANTRKGRPVVGLGRQFEAALNGAVGPGGGRKREREARPSPASEVVRKDVPGKLKDVSSPSIGVPNILQRGEGHAHGRGTTEERSWQR